VVGRDGGRDVGRERLDALDGLGRRNVLEDDAELGEVGRKLAKVLRKCFSALRMEMFWNVSGFTAAKRMITHLLIVRGTSP
jgi:hypothetical protein